MLSEPAGSDGRAAKPAASARFLATASGLTRERDPKQAQGAPARPRISAEPISAANIAISAAAP